MEGMVCKYYQTGYSKFGVHRRKHHVDQICLEESCEKGKCNKRHPTICKYFSTQLVCKFGNTCCYKHIAPQNKSNTTGLQIKISQLESCIENMSEQIVRLENNIEAIKTDFTNKIKLECDEYYWNSWTK